MSKKLNSWIKIETLSYLKAVSLGFLFSILVANCNGGSSTSKVTKDDSADHPQKSSSDLSDPSDPKVNWLAHWDTIPFTADPDDTVKIKEKKMNIRVYVRGWLAEYNAENGGDDYIVREFKFDMMNGLPLKYVVKAFLNPPARTSGHGPGGHLIPPPPPPPPPQ